MKKHYKLIFFFLILFCLCMGIGYSFLNVNLEIDGQIHVACDELNHFINNVKIGNVSEYEVGDTFCITLNGYSAYNGNGCGNGKFKIRISNLSTPDICNIEGFSQTACGVVLEFVDIIEFKTMNSESSNLGGWENTDLRSYINSSIYNALPTYLKNSIIDTTVVSGHGYSDSTNFVTTDKLYFLDDREIYGTSFNSSINTANDFERQLDYYSNIGVTYSNYSNVVKRNSDGNPDHWWLRSAVNNTDLAFVDISYDGYGRQYNAGLEDGVSPAFRIG